VSPTHGSASIGIPPNAQSSRTRRVTVVIILGGLSAFGPLSIDMYLPALPTITRDLGAGDTQVQLTLTACLAGLATGQALAGPLSDTLGRRRPLLVSLLLYGVASLLCAVAPSVYALIALRLLQGMAGAAGIVIARAVVRDLRSGTALAKLFALVMMVNGLAPILAPVIGGQLLRFASWRGLFIVLAVIGTLLLCAVTVGLPESLPADRRRPGSLPRTLRTFAALCADRRFAGHALACGLAFGAMFSYISASPFVLQNVYHLSPQAFSLVFGMNALGIVACSQLSGLLVGRFGAARLLTVGAVVNACGGIGLLLLVLGGAGLPAILTAIFVSVASVGLIAPNATALALAEHGAHAGTASALLGAMQFLIGAIAPPLVGLGGMRAGLGMGVLMAALGTAALLARCLLARGPGPEQTPSDV